MVQSWDRSCGQLWGLLWDKFWSETCGWSWSRSWGWSCSRPLGFSCHGVGIVIRSWSCKNYPSSWLFLAEKEKEELLKGITINMMMHHHHHDHHDHHDHHWSPPGLEYAWCSNHGLGIRLDHCLTHCFGLIIVIPIVVIDYTSFSLPCSSHSFQN